MTDKIPESVWEAACELHVTLFDHCRKDNVFVKLNLEDISRALMARDQRAAEIARRWEQSSWADEVFAARSIADAILSYDEAQQ